MAVKFELGQQPDVRKVRLMSPFRYLVFDLEALLRERGSPCHVKILTSTTMKMNPWILVFVHLIVS